MAGGANRRLCRHHDRQGEISRPACVWHFYASWSINRQVDGGLELPLKLVQARLGHSTITMTADVYGHLFPRGDDGGSPAAAAQALLSPTP